MDQKIFRPTAEETPFHGARIRPCATSSSAVVQPPKPPSGAASGHALSSPGAQPPACCPAGCRPLGQEFWNLREHLGAGPPAGTLQVTLFLPSVDRDGKAIGQEGWCEEALRVFGRLFRGATAFPPGRGVWRDDARGGELVFDDTVLITSYVDPDVLDEGKLRELRRFLHRL
jgi:hypothetical protein